MGVADSLDGIAELCAARGQMARAARLLAAAEALREAAGPIRTRARRAGDERRMEMIRTALDGATLAAEWEAGRAMPAEQAVRYALEEATDA